MSSPRKTPRATGNDAAPRTAKAATARSPRSGRKPVAARPWREVANFVVTFESRANAAGGEDKRITAHKMQEGGITASWTGAEQQPMCRWIAEHVGEGWEPAPGPTDALQAADRPEPARKPAPQLAPEGHDAAPSLPGVALTIAQLRARPIVEPVAPTDARAGDAAAARGRTALAFDLEAVLDIEAADLHGQAVAWPVEFYLRDMHTASKRRLGVASTEVLVAGRASYAARLSEVELPAGIYRVDCVARTPGNAPGFAFRQGPVLQVP
jgi:hypothetical protein